MTVIELGSTPKDKRPPQYDHMLAGILHPHESRGSFILPNSWRFRDEEVVDYLDQAWKELAKTEEEKQGVKKPADLTL